jgi:hypothetical protein
MPPLSESARIILDHMEPDRRYGTQDVRAFCPEMGIERVRDIMHELWIHRQVERVGYSAWRRHRSVSPHAPDPRTVDARSVRPEELFDHAAFTEFFE